MFKTPMAPKRRVNMSKRARKQRRRWKQHLILNLERTKMLRMLQTIPNTLIVGTKILANFKAFLAVVET